MSLQQYGNGTDSTAGANTITHFYDKAGIKAANAINIYGQWADKKNMPLKMGKTFKISKFLHIYDRNEETSPDFATKGYLTARALSDINTSLVAAGLSEGAGAVNQVSIEKITLSTEFARYGQMMEYSDEVEMFSEDAIQVRYREELGALAGQKVEDLIQRDMLGGTNKMYANNEALVTGLGVGVTADDTNADSFKVSFDLIRKASKKLVRNRASKNTKIVTGSTKVDTKTINKAFYAIVGPEVKYDLESLTRGAGSAEEFAYIPAYKYAGASNLAEGEVGSMHDVRFIESESAMVRNAEGAVVPQDYAGALASSGGTDNSSATEGDRDNFDVFPILFPTEGSFATIGLKGHSKIKFNSKSPSAVELGNPYGTRGFFSYNMWYAGLILEPAKLLEVNVLATA